VIGYDEEDDRARGYTVTDSGIVVVPSREAEDGSQRPEAANAALTSDF
jgi:hypothetical protein